MNPAITPPPRGLYLLTPDEPDTLRLLARVAPALAAGVRWLQYRNKRADAALRRHQASELLRLCTDCGVPLIINDDWRLAAELGADGAHLGAEDGDLRAARAALGPQAILGASCYDALERAERAIEAGASYVAFGAFFPSGTKPLARPAPLSLLQQAAHWPLPKVAIGGLRPDNADAVIRAGADLIAVIGAVFDSDHPAQRVREFLSCFPETPTP